MTTDWRERLREKIAANPSASSGPPIEVSEVVAPLDDSATLRAGAMELIYNSVGFLGLLPPICSYSASGPLPSRADKSSCR